MKWTLLASVGVMGLGLASAVAAQAADLTAPALPAWSWSGFYLGAHAGYGWARDPFDNPIFAGIFPSGPTDLTGITSRGWLGGFQAGANWQNGAFLGGLEIDLSGTAISGGTSVSNTLTIPGFTSQTGTATETDKIDMLGSGRARLGFLPWPNVLLYGTGGLAWGRLNQTVTQSQVTTGLISQTVASSSSMPTWRFGWVAGAGAETRLGNSNWLGRIEYLHYDLGDSGNTTANDNIFLPASSSPITVDVVRAGLSYKFGSAPSAGLWPAAPPPIFTKAPQQAAVPWSWSGFYVGGHGGYGWAHDPFSALEPVGGVDVTASGIESRGLLGGVQAGANWQKGTWVSGLEIDLSAALINGANALSAGATTAPGVSTSGTLTKGDKFRMLGSARARVGYLAWPTTLVYGTAGLAWTRWDSISIDTETSTFPGVVLTNTATTADPHWLFGWVAGLGIEQRIADTNLTARVEYLHYDFGNTGATFSSTTIGAVTTITANSSSGHITADVLRAGVSYKFGGDTGAPAPAPVLVTKAAPSATASWSGFYVGGHGGFGWGRDPFVTDEFPGATADFNLTGINSAGWLGGLQAGANWQFDRWLAGAELDFSATGIKGTTSGAATAGTDSSSATQTDQFDWLGSGRARLGFLALPDILLYGSGGLAWTRFTQTTATTEILRGDIVSSVSTAPMRRWGWVAGVGAETRIGHSNWLGRVEYLHYDFGDSGNSSQFSFASGSTTSSINTTGRLTADVVRAGVSYLLQ